MSKAQSNSKLFLSSRGFTLVEIIIVTGMLAGISAAVMTLMNNMQKGQVTSETKMESLELRRVIMTLLMDKGACENTFNGQAIGSSISEIRNTNNSVVYKVGNKYGNNTVQINDMKIVDAGSYNAASSIRSVDLVVSFQKLKRLSSGTLSNATIRLNVKATGPAGIISKCFSDIDQSTQTNCTSLGGTWNGSECALPSCDPNQVLQKMNTDKTAVCVSINCPSGSYFRGLTATGAPECEMANVYQ